MAEEKSLYGFEGDEFYLDLHEGQTRAWKSEKRFILVLAGAQGGKTSFGPWWLDREIKRRGGGDFLAVTSSYGLFKLKMLPETLRVFIDVLGIGRFWAGDGIIEISHPEKGFLAKKRTDEMYARIILRSASSQSGLESATASGVWMDEAGQDEFSLESWEAIRRRVSLKQGRILATTTPYNLGWLKTEWYDRWQDGDPLFDVVQFPSYFNPNFPMDEFELAKRTMQTWKFDMFYRGIFSRPAGLILGDLEDRMFIDPFPIPRNWEVITGVDFGGVNTAFLNLSRNPDSGIWYAFRESMDGDRTTREYAEHEIKEVQSIYPDTTYIGGAPSEDQSRRDFTDNGLSIYRPRVAEVESGLDALIEIIKMDKFRVFNTLKIFKDQSGTYRRKTDPSGLVLPEIVDKRMFHIIDCARYAATEIRERYPVSDGSSKSYAY